MAGFQKNFSISMALLLGLLVVDRLPEWMDQSPEFQSFLGHYGHLRRLSELPADLHKTDLNADDIGALAAGYYEGLDRAAGPVGMPNEKEDVLYRGGFLRYELRPNIKRPYAAGMRVTNSLGMSNPEYGYEKPPHTRRIALLGDSVALGPYGQDFIRLLEDRLNQVAVTPDIQKFQILNFAVYGYSVLQMMDVALEKAPRFHPDAYLVALSNLETMSKAGWPNHVARLVESGTDLKYPYLRQIPAQAGVRPKDRVSVIRLKLEPYRGEVMRWALKRIRDQAASEQARMIIVFVPAAIDPKFSDADFDKLHGAVDGLGVPVIDLRDAFSAVKLKDVQVIPTKDIHPNVEGHQLIFNDLYARIRANPQAWAILAGSGARTSVARSGSSGLPPVHSTH